MKLRVKLGQESQVVNMGQREVNSVTLEELKQVVATQLGIIDHEFFLSLNKSDPLESNGNTLSDSGIVSGDLIHVIRPGVRQAETPRPRAQPLASHSSMSIETVAEAGQVQAQLQSESSMSVSECNRGNDDRRDVEEKLDKDPCLSTDVVTPVQDSHINRYLDEPLVLRESTGNQVPVLLEQLFASASCTSYSDALWVVLHALMLESGFSPHENSMMPTDWKRPGFYTCSYCLSGNAQDMGTCSLAGVGIGTSIVVHGLSSREGETFKTEQLQLKASDYVRVLSQDAAETYRSLDRLSRNFKDTICLPLYNAVLAGAGCPLRQGLEGLPYEIKIRILSLLDVKSLCRTGQTCQAFNQMYKEKTLWRRMFIKSFEKPDDCSLSQDWYEMYKEKLMKKRQEGEERQRLHRLFDSDPFLGFPGTGPFRPVPGLPFQPHIIGGDYDLNPEFAAGGVPIGGLGRRPVNPISPDLGLSSPFGGGRLGIGGRGRGGNMTGSPFSTPFRGGPFM